MNLLKIIIVGAIAGIFLNYSLSGQKNLTFLALGDSYTIGEGVPVFDNFPYQAVKLLRQKGIKINAPEIVAKTGWTTDELINGIENYQLLKKYDLVTLLIGVNNQYRGRNVDEYGIQYKKLLDSAVKFAGGKKERVLVLSIPDWGVTPFAEGKDRSKIATEIDRYNAVKEKITKEAGVVFISITEGTREASGDISLLAKDKLHPSGKEYKRWAEKIVQLFR
ncbi:MAG: SGNH/GDSL hydrolase family protein [Saprospiraceae bacterium]|nr:SGNH/GDSL hydrolase family protein [Saprospiraceae bacterium]